VKDHNVTLYSVDTRQAAGTFSYERDIPVTIDRPDVAHCISISSFSRPSAVVYCHFCI